MILQAGLASLLLPPLLLALLGIPLGLLAWRGRRWAGLAGAAASLLLLVLATPFARGHLLAPLGRDADRFVIAAVEPGAIIVLGADMTTDAARRPDIGRLTLERLRGAAALHRRTGLPVLVTGGTDGGPISLGALMARSLQEEFGVPVAWVEGAASDTRQNALFSTRLLRQDGVAAAYVVSHGWHLPRAAEAFARLGFPVIPEPVGIERAPGGGVTDWLPRADHLGMTWLGLREWVGRLVYALRDPP